jgi:hypothetical protein
LLHIKEWLVPQSQVLSPPGAKVSLNPFLVFFIGFIGFLLQPEMIPRAVSVLKLVKGCHRHRVYRFGLQNLECRPDSLPKKLFR